MAAWAIVARESLLTTARRYHSVITYKELAVEVQEASGISTTQRLDYWVGGLLEKVAIEATRRGEPPLTALCVHQDGTIGPGYTRAPKAVESDPHADVDQLLVAEQAPVINRDDLPESVPDYDGRGKVPHPRPQPAGSS